MNLVARIRAAFVPAPQPTAMVVQFEQGRIRAAAVAAYMAGQASNMRTAYDVALEIGSPALMHEARMHQAGAAAAECMSELLLAAVTGDREGFKRQFNAFVNDAIETGVVDVG